MTTRSIIDYAAEDDALGMREALYAEIMDRVQNHIEIKKQEIAHSLVGSNVEESTEQPSGKFAHYYGSKAKGYSVQITDSPSPIGGKTIPVDNKNHAKKVAKEHGATPHNF